MVEHRIAVAIPTYARRDMLLCLINSLPRDWRTFVSDNNSSLLPMESPLGPDVTVSHSPTLIPMFANWNRALSLVDESCTHVVIPSDDDMFLPEAGRAVAEALRQHPDADMLVFGCDLFNEHGWRWAGYAPASFEALPLGAGFLKFIAGVDARMPGVIFRRTFLNRIGAFDERFKLTAADSELIQRAALLGKTVFVPITIGLYRIWAGSLTHVRVASNQWMQEIDLWVDKIGSLLDSGHQPASRQINVARYKDEIYITNLRAGIHSLKRQGCFIAAWRHVFSRRYPHSASLASQAKLFAHLLLPRAR